MQTLPSQIFGQDIRVMLASNNKEENDAAKLVMAIVKVIEANPTLNWLQLRNADELEIIEGVYISIDDMVEYKIKHNCGIYRIKLIDDNGKTRKDFKYRIAVGQSPKAPKRLGLLSVFPKVKKGSSEDAYIPETDRGKRVTLACQELHIRTSAT